MDIELLTYSATYLWISVSTYFTYVWVFVIGLTIVFFEFNCNCLDLKEFDYSWFFLIKYLSLNLFVNNFTGWGLNHAVYLAPKHAVRSCGGIGWMRGMISFFSSLINCFLTSNSHIYLGMIWRFLELGSMLEPGRPPKTDKATILSDAVRMMEQLRTEAQKLKQSNEDLQEKIKELKVRPGFNQMF